MNSKIVTAVIVGTGIAASAGIKVYHNIKKQETMYSAIHDAVNEIQQVKEPAHSETLSTLVQKCNGNSYEIAVEDFPGEARFEYDAERDTFSVSLGFSARGVNKCEKYEKGTGVCATYSSDFAPSKWVYIDDGIDGYVDRIESYKQWRDGREELMSEASFSLQPDAIRGAIIERIREYREGVDAAEAKLPFYENVGEVDVADIITMKKEGLLSVQNIYAAQLDFFSGINPQRTYPLVKTFECY